jgi:hypothetical protein
LVSVPRAALRVALPIPIEPSIVASCLDVGQELDHRFELAWRGSLKALPKAQRTGALPGVTGHVAESVVELMLHEHGYVPLAHHASAGRHGVDLLMLHLAAEMVFAFEVKGTLRQRHIPRLTHGELQQMSDAWIDKPDNPAMRGTELVSGDVYGAVAAINFIDMTIRFAYTADFRAFDPVERVAQLTDPTWVKAST